MLNDVYEANHKDQGKISERKDGRIVVRKVNQNLFECKRLSGGSNRLSGGSLFNCSDICTNVTFEEKSSVEKHFLPPHHKNSASEVCKETSEQV